MTKRHLTKQQKRRIHDNQQQRIARAKNDDTEDLPDSPEQTGLVIANYGKQLVIESTDTEHILCRSKQNLGSVVCGDRVIFHATDEQHRGLIVAILPRRSFLSRPGFAGKIKAIAANIDRIFIVTAAIPELNEGMLDRYLVAAEQNQLEAIIVFNKLDLLDEHQRNDVEVRLGLYQTLGYKVIYTSSKLEHGLDQLLQELQNYISIMVGQSGVGKSSLIQQLIPKTEIRIGEISEATGKGAHTTTTSRLYHLDSGGDLIDSPGVREFGITEISLDALTDAFREFRPLLGQCQFRNCEHLQHSAGCAIIAAIATGDVSEQRYLSYLRIRESLLV